jgi:hypothetical protein
MRQLLRTSAISDPHLRHPTSAEIVGQVRTPIIATAANLAQARSINQQQTPPALQQIGGRGDLGSQEFSQEPQQPGTTFAQALAPGRVGDIGHADEYCPSAQGTKRQAVKDIRQQGAQEIGGTRKTARALEGFQAPSVLVKGRR